MKITPETIVTLPAGALVKLSAEQSAARAHLLKAEKEVGTFTATTAIHFKAGDAFEYLGDPAGLPRSLQPAKAEKKSDKTAKPVEKANA